MPEWKPLLGRVTLFSAAPLSSVSALDLFKAIWSGEPDSYQRSVNPLQPTVAQGLRNAMLANCVVQINRVDLSLQPSPARTTKIAHPVATIDDTVVFNRSLNQIIDAIRKGIIPGAMNRVALYLHFASFGSRTFAEANRIVMEVIPKNLGVAISEEEDFIFQINRPQQSGKIADIKLNALTKWSVDRVQLFTLNISTPGISVQQIVPAPPEAQTFITPAVIFDNNSQLEKMATSFDANQQADLLIEALGIASKMQKEIGLNVEGF
jgi:hypothetical protein